MRIGIDIHTIGDKKTGNEIYIQNLVDNLPEQNASQNKYYLYHTHEIDISIPQAIFKKIIPHNPLIRIPFSFPYSLKRDEIDVALFQYYSPPICPCPIVLVIHDISFEFFPEFFNPLEHKLMKLLVPYSAKKSSHIITGSQFSKQQICQKYNISEEKVSVTAYSASSKFRKIKNDQWLQQQTQSMNLSTPFILAVGNLQPRKNIERLIRVYAKLRKEEKIKHDLVLVGQKSWKGQYIFNEIEKNDVISFVKTSGYVTEDQLIALYNLSDFFVYPSYYEGFGLPILEAMSCETPVIASNTSSIPEVAGEAALLFNPKSDKELMEAILKLADNPTLKEKLISKGINQVKKFSWKNAAHQTWSLLENFA